MKSNNIPDTKNNIIQLFTRKPWQDTHDTQIIRLAPELDGLEMLYCNDSDPSRIFNMKIVCWGLNAQGDVDAMVPWLGKLQCCRSLSDPLNGRCEGYLNKTHNNVFFEAPAHKVKELVASSRYFSNACDTNNIVQEIPDNIGTHAIFSEDKFETMILKPVISWRLLNSGQIQAMIADHDKTTKTPVLPRDDCLCVAEEQKDFKYFFHRLIANKIKAGDEEVLAAFSGLLNL